MRHFYVSALIADCLSVKVVQNRLGHATAKMAFDVYAHLWPEVEDRTRDAIDWVLLADRRDTNVTQQRGNPR